mmetsp:Transcript_29975/g.41186  ORF Transcript_29975/g.41186 Transcript_29975/m.41186 type:complete len:109 (-) Transcript_29975:96-422(-)|eukprot:CAMPEP_0170085766 /NCGR_PEP_ID=MMETSP0019_2-20121128/20566_1 /TAXON_ID=98059 /ORGANISM="Dinobryon sp., Strain UTEXLB2267" /LENGTH=108 /DNA_ID=CAMNT_0010302389 /DNA_START=10 /DNA_END=336 /DNA_ORIENTATION=+
MNQLKAAEKEATLLVQEARKARVDKMKEAKVEAENVLSSYRAEMEANYQAELAKLNGKSGAAGNELQVNTNNDISSMNREFESKKAGVEKMLVDLVLKVNIKAPKARE